MQALPESAIRIHILRHSIHGSRRISPDEQTKVLPGLTTNAAASVGAEALSLGRISKLDAVISSISNLSVRFLAVRNLPGNVLALKTEARRQGKSRGQGDHFGRAAQRRIEYCRAVQCRAAIVQAFSAHEHLTDRDPISRPDSRKRTESGGPRRPFLSQAPNREP